jgi:glycine cleavage system H protein
MAYPENLKYTKEHEWMRLDGKVAAVGITQFAQEQLGDVVYLELPKVGDAMKKGQAFGVVESTKAVSELFAPANGKVVEVNSALTDAPETLNRDPYDAGWLIKMEVDGGADDLLDATAYTQFVKDSQH